MPGNPGMAGAADGATSTRSRRVTQQGRTQQENQAWPRQSLPSLHKCGKTPLFPLWDYYFFFRMLQTLLQGKMAMRWWWGGEQKSLVMGLNQNTELGQDREAALCRGLGVWDHRRSLDRCHRSSQHPQINSVPSACVPPQHSFKETKKIPKFPAASSFFAPSTQEE